MMKKYFKKNDKKNEAFTIVETLIAISIFSVSIISMMTVLGGGVSDINYAKSKMTATYFAQEGIEYVRNQRDNYFLSGASGWNSFLSAIVTMKCPSYDTKFSRACSFNEDISGEVKVSSDVSWSQKGVTHHVILTEELFNWVE